VVLASRDEAYAVRSSLAVIPVATRARRIPVEVPLGRDEGLPRACVANADTIVTIPKSALAAYAGVLGPEKLAALDRAIRFALGLD
jgi:mRNA-degrading endonuclease toxin of MazEF toxin-antitoxin module